MKFNYLRLLPALLIFNVFAPFKVHSSMKDAYQKNSANKNACTKKTAQFRDYYAGSKSPLGPAYDFKPYYTYFCVLKDGTIMKFTDFFPEPEYLGSTKEAKLTDPDYSSTFESYSLTDKTKGFRTEYSVEDEGLIKYVCTGYYKCLDSPSRYVVANVNMEFVQSLYEKAELFIEKGEYEEAIKYSTKILNMVPEETSTLEQRAWTFSLTKQYKKALKDYTKITQIDPNYPYAYNGKCDANIQLKQYKKALSDCNIALNLTKPEDEKLIPYINLNLGIVKYDLGEKQNSCKNYAYVISNSNLIDKEDYQKYIELNKDVKWCKANNFLSEN